MNKRLPVLIDTIIISLIVTLAMIIYHYEELKYGIPFRYYGGDDIYMMVNIKAYATGDFIPLFQKFLDVANAPFSQSNWNDFPSPDFVYFIPALFYKIFGLLTGTSVYMITIAVGIGLAFYFTGKLLGYSRVPLIIFGILFACSPYFLYRSIGHLNLTTMWHLPFLLLAVIYLHDHQAIKLDQKRKKYLISIIAVLIGLFNEYYLFCFLWLAGLILLGQIANRNSAKIRSSVWVIGISLFSFIISHFDTLTFRIMHGPNPAGLGRTLQHQVHYGLKLPDMIFPMNHNSEFVQNIADTLYYSQIEFHGSPSYIGLVGIVCFFILLWQGTVMLSSRRFESISLWYWIALGIIGLSIVGGINFLLGSLGLLVIRASGRLSILLLMSGFLYVCQLITKKEHNLSKLKIALLSLLLPVGLYDQIPDFPKNTGKLKSKERYENDVNLGAFLNTEFEKGSMIFQYPVKKMFTGSIYHGLLRPYLHTNDLRYSYGSMIGRADATWQNDLHKLSTRSLISEIENYGFSCLLIRKDFLSQEDEQIIEEIQQLGYNIEFDCSEYTAFKLRPSMVVSVPQIPHYNIAYAKGFYKEQFNSKITWAWAQENARVELLPPYIPEGYEKVQKDSVNTFLRHNAVQSDKHLAKKSMMKKRN